jgi:hypothetical protein
VPVLIACLLVVLSVLGGATLAPAHPLDPAPPPLATDVAGQEENAGPESAPPSRVAVEESVPAPPRPAAWPAGSACALLLAVGAAAACRQRRVLAMVLLLLVGSAAFETGLHSVHHLTEPSGKSECAWAAATSHLGATVVDPVCLHSPITPAHAPLTLPALSAPSRTVFLRDLGRAPPA